MANTFADEVQEEAEEIVNVIRQETKPRIIDDVAKYYIMQVLTFDEENRIWNYGKEHYLPLQNNIFDVLNRMNNEITKLLKL